MPCICRLKIIINRQNMMQSMLIRIRLFYNETDFCISSSAKRAYNSAMQASSKSHFGFFNSSGLGVQLVVVSPFVSFACVQA